MMTKKRPRKQTKSKGPTSASGELSINLGNMTLEDFKLYSLAALKGFLALRKKSLEGTYDELASR